MRSRCSVGAAVTDYIDGKLARDRNLVTNLGRLLDPLADKVLLVATLLPIFLLQGTGIDNVPAATVLSALPQGWREPAPFITPLGAVGLPLWVLVVVLGRELFMTLFSTGRGVARRRDRRDRIREAQDRLPMDVDGTALFWFAASRAATVYGWTSLSEWRPIAIFIGIVGVGAMAGAVSLTLYSLAQYLRRYGGLFAYSN